MSHDIESRFFSASPARLFGRETELRRIERWVAASAIGGPTALAVAGPAGCGKSALIRAAMARSIDDNPNVVPIFIDLESFESKGPLASVWTHLLRELARSLIAFADDLALDEPPLLGATPAVLGRMARAADLSAWAGAIEFGVDPGDPAAGGACWLGMLRACADESASKPVVAIDGVSRLTAIDAARDLIHPLARAAAVTGAPLLFESPDSADTAPIEGVCPLVLSGLKDADAAALARAIAEPRGDAPDAEALADIPRRLGGRPAAIARWTERWLESRQRTSDARRAEEAYLSLLESSPESDRWRAALESAVPFEWRADALALLARMAEATAPRPLAAAEIVARLGRPAAEIERALVRLESAEIVRRSGDRFAPSELAAIRDWIELRAGQAGASASLARTLLLKRLLAERPDAAALANPAPDVRELLGRFALQEPPRALFDCAQYYEALGGLAPERRAEALSGAKARLRLPESLGVDEVAPPRGRSRGPSFPVFLSIGHREAIHRRSHEETWIVADATRLPTLTSTEVAAFAKAAQALERKLGVGRYTRWIAAGAVVSPEALGAIARAGVLCSDAEQLNLLADFLAPAEADEKQAERVATAKPESHSTPVIEIDRLAEPSAGGAVSRLSVPARVENEAVVAVMAERIAQRAGFDEESAGLIKMAALEGCLNAIESSANPEKRIQVVFIERPEELEIAIENEGPPFDPLAVPDPDPRAKMREANKRGWGIKLMREFVDEVVYEPVAHGMRLRLLKSRAPSPKSRESEGA